MSQRREGIKAPSLAPSASLSHAHKTTPTNEPDTAPTCSSPSSQLSPCDTSAGKGLSVFCSSLSPSENTIVSMACPTSQPATQAAADRKVARSCAGPGSDRPASSARSSEAAATFTELTKTASGARRKGREGRGLREGGVGVCEEEEVCRGLEVEWLGGSGGIGMGQERGEVTHVLAAPI